MDRQSIEKQIQVIELGIKSGSLDKEDRRIWVILEYLHTLLKSDGYSVQKLEDLRRLVLEMNFDEGVGFEEWIKGIGVKSN